MSVSRYIAITSALRQVLLEQVGDLELDLVGDAGGFGVVVGFLDALRIDVDAEAARTALGRRDHHPAVAAAEIDHVIAGRRRRAVSIRSTTSCGVGT